MLWKYASSEPGGAWWQIQDALRCGPEDDGSEEDLHEGEIAVEEGRPKVQEPRQHAVILHNDDYTTFDFVVEVLQKFFRKTSEEAAQITMSVHHEGRGLAGVYSYQIAETKVAQVGEYARERGFPLKCSTEPV